MASPLAVLYKGPELLALHKPSGLPSVSLRTGDTESALAQALLAHPELRSVPGRREGEPALLHRLDTGTSGVLLFARTPEAFARATQHWEEIDKRYRAWITPGPDAPVPAPRVITAPLAHSAKSAKRMLVLTPQTPRNRLRGKPLPALTEVLAVHGRGGPVAESQTGNWDLEIAIHRGLMHQIRAHLAHQGWPILGDPIYGSLEHRARSEEAGRLWLHAWRVHIPWIEEERGGVWITAPLPW